MNRNLILLLLPLLYLTACSNAARWESSPSASTVYEHGNASSRGHAVAAATATQQIGRPYKWGGSTPKGFDCSGLVQYSYNNAGMSVPRTSRAQYSASQHISLRQARTGDLLFFRFSGRISHVGIYLGDGRFVHSPSSGKHVEVASLQQPTYRKAFVTAGRLGTTARR
ncbi:MAG: C40 family peptidase [Gammaproteobacteria bacterium]|nr:C40 family peptidase [Gammaproteobacteria bacterium]